MRWSLICCFVHQYELLCLSFSIYQGIFHLTSLVCCFVSKITHFLPLCTWWSAILDLTAGSRKYKITNQHTFSRKFWRKHGGFVSLDTWSQSLFEGNCGGNGSVFTIPFLGIYEFLAPEYVATDLRFEFITAVQHWWCNIWKKYKYICLSTVFVYISVI